MDLDAMFSTEKLDVWENSATIYFDSEAALNSASSHTKYFFIRASSLLSKLVEVPDDPLKEPISLSSYYSRNSQISLSLKQVATCFLSSLSQLYPKPQYGIVQDNSWLLLNLSILDNKLL